MHNSKKANLEFEITFAETNLNWELSADSPDKSRIDFHKQKIKKLKKEVANLIKKN